MITIAVSKGRIANNFFKLLASKQLIDKYDNSTRKLNICIEEYNIYLVKPIDVVKLVEYGYADIGIIGSDVINELEVDDIVELLDLKTGVCNFKLASKPDTLISDINIIATKYPNTSKRLLESIGMNSKIVCMQGSLEIAPIINYSDAIIDLVETGTTLKENGLIELKTLEYVSTRVISRTNNIKDEKVKRLIKEIG